MPKILLNMYFNYLKLLIPFLPESFTKDILEINKQWEIRALPHL